MLRRHHLRSMLIMMLLRHGQNDATASECMACLELSEHSRWGWNGAIRRGYIGFQISTRGDGGRWWVTDKGKEILNAKSKEN